MALLIYDINTDSEVKIFTQNANYPQDVRITGMVTYAIIKNISVTFIEKYDLIQEKSD